MNCDPRGLYAALGVGPDATGADIRRRYRALLRSLHPDVGAAGGEDVRRVLEAFAVLGHPESRADYDPAYERSEGFESAGWDDDGGNGVGVFGGSAAKPGTPATGAAVADPSGRPGRDIPVRRRATQPLVRVTPVRWERGPW